MICNVNKRRRLSNCSVSAPLSSDSRINIFFEGHSVDLQNVNSKREYNFNKVWVILILILHDTELANIDSITNSERNSINWNGC